MQLLTYSARHFRCITELHVDFRPSLNLIIGANAQGKTSLLESICFLSLSRSPRTNNEKELVQYRQDWFILKGELAEEIEGQRKTIETRWNKGNKKIYLNGIELEKVSELLGHLHIIFLSSDFANLVREGASVRRKFLDIQISQKDKEYLYALQGYQRALRQRNELLKKGEVKPDEFVVWEMQLAKFGKILIEKRKQFIDDITPFATHIHSSIESSEKLEIQYVPSVTADKLFSVLGSNRAHDIQKGQTQKGPHRDEVEIKINGYPVRAYASQGQQKTSAFSILISELYVYIDKKKSLPMLLADELFSDLDIKRIRKFLQVIPEDVQSLITAVDNDVIKQLNLQCSVYRIRNGSLEKT